MVRGYLGDPAITAANFTDGWLRTGDLGTLSEAGDLSIRGRIKELINRGGEKISPERVEGVLASHPNVLEVAVFGVPDKMYGETVAAVIVPRDAARRPPKSSPSSAGTGWRPSRFPPASRWPASCRTPPKARWTAARWPNGSAAGVTRRYRR